MPAYTPDQMNSFTNGADYMTLSVDSYDQAYAMGWRPGDSYGFVTTELEHDTDFWGNYDNPIHVISISEDVVTRDSIITQSGNDFVFTGGGNDWISTERGNDFVGGGSGDDFVLAGGGSDTVDGGEGNDHIQGDGILTVDAYDWDWYPHEPISHHGGFEVANWAHDVAISHDLVSLAGHDELHGGAAWSHGLHAECAPRHLRGVPCDQGCPEQNQATHHVLDNLRHVPDRVFKGHVFALLWLQRFQFFLKQSISFLRLSRRRKAAKTDPK